MSYFVTGATGFIGRHLVERLLEREGDVYALVREGSREKLDELIERWGAGDRVKPVTGDLAEQQLGISDEDKQALQGVEHFFHLAAIYDMTADETRNAMLNVGGTQNAVDLANAVSAEVFHHVSSVAVAGRYKGFFTEDMFDEGQELPHPYHRTKFEAEKLVREKTRGAWRVYRPAIVVGNSKTGEMDKIDGPYYFFKPLQKVRHALPEWVPLVSIEWGNTNIVPVDFVAAAIDHIAHLEGLDGQAFHVVDPQSRKVGEVMNVFAKAGHAPRTAMRIDKKLTDMLPKGVLHYAMQIPALKGVRRSVLQDLGIPEEVLDEVAFTAKFDARDAQRALQDSGIELPALESYAHKLWDYWERNLDPDLFKDRSFEGAVNGRTVLITGASSGIGRAAALKIAAAGGVPILVARSMDKLEELKKEIVDQGGTAYAYSADLSDTEAIDAAVETILGDHAAVDMLVNNAGRSIRRSVMLSTDRFHDYERTVQLNYLGAVKLILALLPHMKERRLRPRRQRVLDRRADEPAAVLRLRRLEGGARRVHPRGELGDDRRQHHLHDDPHAARADADDRADEDLRLVPDDLAGRGRRPHLRGDPRQAEADQHEARHVRRGALRGRPEGRRPDPAHGLQGVPGVGRREGPEGRERARVGRGRRALAPHEGRALVAANAPIASARRSGWSIIENVRERSIVSTRASGRTSARRCAYSWGKNLSSVAHASSAGLSNSGSLRAASSVTSASSATVRRRRSSKTLSSANAGFTHSRARWSTSPCASSP